MPPKAATAYRLAELIFSAANDCRQVAAFRDYAKSANITPHAAEFTPLSLAAAAIIDAAERLRHADLASAIRHYLIFTARSFRHAFRQIADIITFSPASQPHCCRCRRRIPATPPRDEAAAATPGQRHCAIIFASCCCQCITAPYAEMALLLRALSLSLCQRL